MELMENLATSVVLVGLVVFLGMFARWHRVLDDPEYFNRQKLSDLEWFRWTTEVKGTVAAND